MCGIVGAVARRRVSRILLEGLRRLEYRGYDSAGIATLESTGITRVRQVGKVSALANLLEQQELAGTQGIAHTRWATHGVASEVNAHPHMSGEELALVHNGIIDNYQKVKTELIERGYQFNTQTDSEAVVHLIQDYYQTTGDLFKAVTQAVKHLEGAYAIAVMHVKEPGKLICARQGAPLVIGVGIDEHFVASDQLALSQVTDQFIYLEEQDIAVITADTLEIYNAALEKVERKIHRFDHVQDAADKGPYKHFMLKEIYEQPEVIARCLEGRLSGSRVLEEAFGSHAKQIFDQTQAIQIVACGTSYHAGLVAKYWIEELANIPCQVEVASEYRYRNTAVLPNSLFVTLSQSGETADTLAALRKAKGQGFQSTLTICNVPGSTMVRESDIALMMNAGREIGVASTKAFVAQLVALMLLTVSLARRHNLTTEQEAAVVADMKQLPGKIADILKLDSQIKSLSKSYIEKHHALFLGRGAMYPIAMEGALKLKEISYIHAESYPAGELKHGPLALVDKEMPIVVVAPNDDLLEKLKSNLEVVSARGGEILVFSDTEAELSEQANLTVLPVGKMSNLLAPLLMVVPLQLLSYHVAVLKGTDVDQPRNLAKSVTVE